MNTRKTKPDEDVRSEEDDVKFCLNCDDMDDLAIDDPEGDITSARKRYEDCVKRGNFDGDLCSRLYVIDDNIDPDHLMGAKDED